MGERDIVTIFAKCSRLLSGIALEAKDEFLAQLCSKESDKLLSAFIGFLKVRGETVIKSNHLVQPEILQQKIVAKSSDIVQHENRVAQYSYQLIFQIKNILNLADILKHLGFSKPVTPLLLEKNLLLLELAVFNSFNSEKKTSSKTGDSQGKNIKPRKKPGPSPEKFGRIHREILELIKSNGQTQNSEVFSRLNGTSRRTLKRKLSELVRLKMIRRFSEGKKVFYALAAGPTSLQVKPAEASTADPASAVQN